MALTVLKFTQAEINHIIGAMDTVKDEGSYYGPRDQYWKRHEKIMDKLWPDRNTPKPGPCKTCDGGGKLVEEHLFPGPRKKTTIPCPDCNGTGQDQGKERGESGA